MNQMSQSRTQNKIPFICFDTSGHRYECQLCFCSSTHRDERFNSSDSTVSQTNYKNRCAYTQTHTRRIMGGSFMPPNLGLRILNPTISKFHYSCFLLLIFRTADSSVVSEGLSQVRGQTKMGLSSLLLPLKTFGQVLCGHAMFYMDAAWPKCIG